MDIKEIVEQLVEKIKGDSGLLEKFKNGPVETVKSLVGDKVPEGGIDAIVEAVKAKIGTEGLIGDAVDKVKGLFGKK